MIFIIRVIFTHLTIACALPARPPANAQQLDTIPNALRSNGNCGNNTFNYTSCDPPLTDHLE